MTNDNRLRIAKTAYVSPHSEIILFRDTDTCYKFLESRAGTSHSHFRGVQRVTYRTGIPVRQVKSVVQRPRTFPFCVITGRQEARDRVA